MFSTLVLKTYFHLNISLTVLKAKYQKNKNSFIFPFNLQYTTFQTDLQSNNVQEQEYKNMKHAINKWRTYLHFNDNWTISLNNQYSKLYKKARIQQMARENPYDLWLSSIYNQLVQKTFNIEFFTFIHLKTGDNA